MATPDAARTLKVVRSEIDADEQTTSLLFPNRNQGPWLPFERFAETITTSRTKIGRHPHRAEEVLMYVLEGTIEHVDGSGRRESLTGGTVALISAHEEVSHELATVRGKRARWLSVVLRMPWHTEPPPTSVQIKGAGDPKAATDGTVQTPVVGPLARADSFGGLQLLDVEFAKDGTGFFRIGRDRRGVAYGLSGAGTVEGSPVEPGSGVLMETVSGVAIGGSPGFRVVFATAPVGSGPRDEPVGQIGMAEG
jgi:redox-sensitive bicupin YhaK (pirin superfamily)